MLKEWSSLRDEAATVHYSTFFMDDLQKYFQRTVSNLWSVHKLLIPTNISNFHWVLMVIYTQRGLMEY